MARRRKSRAGSLTLRYAILIAWTLFCLAPIIWFMTIGLRPRTEIVLPRPLFTGDRVAARIPAGRYRISFEGEGTASRSARELTVRRGQNARVDLVVGP